MRRLAQAGTVLMVLGFTQVAAVAYFSGRGGVEGILSPVAAVAAMWPVAALFVYLGRRMREAAG